MVNDLARLISGGSMTKQIDIRTDQEKSFDLFLEHLKFQGWLQKPERYEEYLKEQKEDQT